MFVVINFRLKITTIFDISIFFKLFYLLCYSQYEGQKPKQKGLKYAAIFFLWKTVNFLMKEHHLRKYLLGWKINRKIPTRKRNFLAKDGITPLVMFLYTKYDKDITKWLFWNCQKSYKEISHPHQLLVICLCYCQGFLSQSYS